MHLHGQFFKVIARNGESVDEPYWRDTVLVGGTETIDVMLMPRDKGQWAMHCHIQEHAEAGMMTTLIIN
jgi:FtsP/CotA-like multicopper oxidase with cupredoxin domain